MIAVDIGEFEKMEGCVTCLSVLVDGKGELRMANLTRGPGPGVLDGVHHYVNKGAPHDSQQPPTSYRRRLAGGLVVAGCGGGGNQATAASAPDDHRRGLAHGRRRRTTASLGKILVDSKGRTVYLFQKDTGSMSTCSGACATNWPPVTTTGKPRAGTGVTASMLGTTTRSDGTKQVTYNGHPLYLYIGRPERG